MSSNSSPTSAPSAISSQPVQTVPPDQPRPANLSATASFTPEADPGSRIVTQLDELTAAIGQATSGVKPGTIQMPSSAIEEEECLESYLRRYVQKLTGNAPNPVRSDSLACDNSPACDNILTKSQPEEPIPCRQPTIAAENRDQLTAMRALANDSARRTLAESTQNLMVVNARRAFYQATAASIASTTVVLAHFFTHSAVALSSASLLFAVALCLSFRFVWLCRPCSASVAS